MARNGNTMNAGISREMRKAVYKRDGYRCAVCDATEGLQIHHIKPRGKGGANHPMNLITLCWRCHAAVHGSIMGDEYATAAGCEKGMTPEDVRREVMFYYGIGDYAVRLRLLRGAGGDMVSLGRLIPSPFFAAAMLARSVRLPRGQAPVAARLPGTR